MGRPLKTLAGFVGQTRVVGTCRTLAMNSLNRGIPIPHFGFFGPSGTGKTTLASALAGHLGTFAENARPTNIHTTHAGRGCLMPLHEALVGAKDCDLIFVDEAHALTLQDAELLYRAIDADETFALCEDGRLDRGRFEPIGRVTIVVATNRPGALPAALRSRILELELDAYSVRELKAIAERVGSAHKVEMTPQAARILAQRCNGTPRHIEQLARLVASFHERRVTQGDVEAVLDSHYGLDEHGLSPLQRRLLILLARSPSGGMRAEHVVHQLGMDPLYARNEIEAQLQRRGFIQIAGNHVRRITDAGRRAIECHLSDSGGAVDDDGPEGAAP